MLSINDLRRLKHSKNERIHIQKTAPTAKDLQENVPEIRVVNGRVFQYVKIGSTIYRHEFQPFDSRLTKTKLSTSNIQRTNQANGEGWPHANEYVGWSADGPPMWMKFDNGVIMQWGVRSISSASVVQVMLPKKYDHDIWVVFTTKQQNPGGDSDAEEAAGGRKYINWSNTEFGGIENGSNEYYLDRIEIDMDETDAEAVVSWMTLGW